MSHDSMVGLTSLTFLEMDEPDYNEVKG